MLLTSNACERSHFKVLSIANRFFLLITAFSEVSNLPEHDLKLAINCATNFSEFFHCFKLENITKKNLLRELNNTLLFYTSLCISKKIDIISKVEYGESLYKYLLNLKLYGDKLSLSTDSIVTVFIIKSSLILNANESSSNQPDNLCFHNWLDYVQLIDNNCMSTKNIKLEKYQNNNLDSKKNFVTSTPIKAKEKMLSSLSTTTSSSSESLNLSLISTAHQPKASSETDVELDESQLSLSMIANLTTTYIHPKNNLIIKEINENSSLNATEIYDGTFYIMTKTFNEKKHAYFFDSYCNTSFGYIKTRCERITKAKTVFTANLLGIQSIVSFISKNGLKSICIYTQNNEFKNELVDTSRKLNTTEIQIYSLIKKQVASGRKITLCVLNRLIISEMERLKLHVNSRNENDLSIQDTFSYL